MRLLFICGSLQSGKDGVGDYTRIFCAKLIRKGHDVKMLSISDKGTSSILVEAQYENGTNIDVLRIPNSLDWSEGQKIATVFIADFSPDWLCLQYVPFSFDKRGLPFKLADRLKTLGGDRKWYIMFHELWLGMDRESSIKYRLWGVVQKLLIISLYKKLKPIIVNTQSQLYFRQLKSLNFDVNILPLFGNVPVIGDRKKTNSNNLNFVVFGGLHHGSMIEKFAEEVSSFASSSSIDVKLTFVGRNGKEKDHWLKVCSKYNLGIEDFGEQSVERISDIFLGARFGLTTTPYILTDKSGSVAAMREHGLAIICLGREWTTSYKVKPNGADRLIPFESGKIPGFLHLDGYHTERNYLDQIVHQFESRLLNN